jgi:hypothetical protein
VKSYNAVYCSPIVTNKISKKIYKYSKRAHFKAIYNRNMGN